jgi:hypothetical protein
MKFLITTFIVSLILIISTSCTCSSCGNEESVIPYLVLSKADQFVANQTGATFFQNYIKPDFSKSKKIENGYFIVYNLFIPEKPFVKGEIRFSVDTLGNLNPNMEVFGIPLCKEFPEDCEFNIDQEAAKKIAIKNGLEEGIKEWKFGFLYDVVYQKYVWHVLSTLSESEGEYGYRASGKELIISPNTGEVLQKNDWKIN